MSFSRDNLEILKKTKNKRILELNSRITPNTSLMFSINGKETEKFVQIFQFLTEIKIECKNMKS